MATPIENTKCVLVEDVKYCEVENVEVEDRDFYSIGLLFGFFLILPFILMMLFKAGD